MDQQIKIRPVVLLFAITCTLLGIFRYGKMMTGISMLDEICVLIGFWISLSVIFVLLSGLQGSCVTAQVYAECPLTQADQIGIYATNFWINMLLFESICAGFLTLLNCNVRFASIWSAGILCNGAACMC